MIGFVRLWMQRLRGFNLLMVAATQVLVQYVLIQRHVGRSELPLWQFSLFVGVTVLIAAGGYVVNDLFDACTDSVNRPERRWVGKAVARGQAWRLYWALTAVGALLSCYLAWAVGNPELWGIYWLAVGGMFAYSRYLKGSPLWGNLFVACFTAFVVWIVWFANRQVLAVFAERQPEHFAWLQGLMWSYCIFAFLATLVRELVKDLEDVRGDRRAGLRTLPLVAGMRFAKRLAQAVGILLGAALLLAGGWLAGQGREVATAWAWGLGSWTLAIAWMLGQAACPRQFGRLSAQLKALMAAGLIGLLML